MKENENQEWIEKVTAILNGYKGLKLRAQQLYFEIENYVPAASGEDVIDTMIFGKPDGTGAAHFHNSKVSDKTADTAITYEKKVASLNNRHKQEMENDLRQVTMEMMRLEHYIELLGGDYTNVLKMQYINGLTYLKIAKALNLSLSTMKRVRLTGIRKLASMYQAISVTQSANDIDAQ